MTASSAPSPASQLWSLASRPCGTARTRTGMGGRLLRRRLLAPSIDVAAFFSDDPDTDLSEPRPRYCWPPR